MRGATSPVLVRRNSYSPIVSDLGLLKRDKALQKRYEAWSESLKQKFTSNGAHSAMRRLPELNLYLNIPIVDYLINHRLQWGKPDRLSLLQSQIQEDIVEDAEAGQAESPPAYFTANMPRKFISIILNDWPYSGAGSYQRRSSVTF